MRRQIRVLQHVLKDGRHAIVVTTERRIMRNAKCQKFGHAALTDRFDSFGDVTVAAVAVDHRQNESICPPPTRRTHSVNRGDARAASQPWPRDVGDLSPSSEDKD